MSDTQARLQRILAIGERLAAAIDADIKALEKGRPQEMKSIEPETQKLSLLYEKELAGFSPKEAAGMPPELRARLVASGKRLNDCLERQQRLLKRMRTISEGMVRAVAEEMQRRQIAARPYAPRPMAKPRPTAAMVYNSVV
ncbi:MAG TPA: hypothetical protein VLV55_00200 [Rhizomicrobium sp.]|nr:hypothetical protein [Rhizomicrobium sp.]